MSSRERTVIVRRLRKCVDDFGDVGDHGDHPMARFAPLLALNQMSQ
jgi:hypothetical protein